MHHMVMLEIYIDSEPSLIRAVALFSWKRFMIHSQSGGEVLITITDAGKYRRFHVQLLLILLQKTSVFDFHLSRSSSGLCSLLCMFDHTYGVLTLLQLF